MPYLQQEFAKLESKNKLKVEMLGGGMPWMADYKHWNYEAAKRATEVSCGTLMCYVSPEHDLSRASNAPCTFYFSFPL